MMYVRFLGLGIAGLAYAKLDEDASQHSFHSSALRLRRPTGFYWQEKRWEADRTNGQNDWIKNPYQKTQWKKRKEKKEKKITVESERVTITWVESIIEVQEKQIFALGILCALLLRSTQRPICSVLVVNHIGAILHGAGYGRSHLPGWRSHSSINYQIIFVYMNLRPMGSNRWANSWVVRPTGACVFRSFYTRILVWKTKEMHPVPTPSEEEHLNLRSNFQLIPRQASR